MGYRKCGARTPGRPWRPGSWGELGGGWSALAPAPCPGAFGALGHPNWIGAAIGVQDGNSPPARSL